MNGHEYDEDWATCNEAFEFTLDQWESHGRKKHLLAPEEVKVITLILVDLKYMLNERKNTFEAVTEFHDKYKYVNKLMLTAALKMGCEIRRK